MDRRWTAPTASSGGDHPSEHHRDQHFEALVTGQGRETGPSCGTMDSPWPPAQPRWRGGGATQNRTGEWEICSLLPYQLGYGATETALLVVGLSALVNLPARAYFGAGFLARGTTNPRERRRSTLRSWRRL